MSFRRNVLAMLTGTAMAQAIPLAISPLLTRLYSPEAIGLQTLFMGWAAALGVAATCRYDLAVVLPDKEEDADHLTALVLTLCAGVLLLLALTVTLFGPALRDAAGYPGQHSWLWLLLPMLAGTTLTLLASAHAARARHFTPVARAAVFNQAAYALIAVAVGLLGAQADGLVWAKVGGQAVAAATVLLVFGASLRRALRGIQWASLRASAARYRQFLIYNTPYSLIGTVARDMPIFVFAAMSATSAAGFYGLTRSVLMAPTLLVSNALSQVFYREAVALRGSPRLLALTLALLRLGLMAGAPLFAFCALWGDEVFALLFGQGWRRAGEYAMIMAPAAWMALQTGWPERLFEVCMRQDLSFKVQISADIVMAASVIVPLMLGHDVIVAIAAFTIANLLYHLVYLGAIFRAAGFEAARLGRLLGAAWLRFALICLALAIVRELSGASLAAGAALAVLCAAGALLAARTRWRQITTLMQAKEATP